jgi:hypothetical protein
MSTSPFDTINASAGPEVDLTTGVVFVQQIPPAAKTLYVKGVADFDRDPDRGVQEIEAALNIFPEYFDALNWLGKEYVSRRNYEKGYPYADVFEIGAGAVHLDMEVAAG